MSIPASSYRLSLDVDFAGLAFSGVVRIGLRGATSELTLNSIGLEIDRVEAQGRALEFETVPSAEELRVKGIPPGTSELIVGFRGRVSVDSLSGFYRSHHGTESYFLTTHLAPTGARRVFPCIDHPAAKATFEAEVTADAGLEVIFNTDPKEVVATGDRKTWKFPPTPKMSTYLLYLGIGEFDTLEETRSGLRVAVKGPPGTRESFGWGLENGHLAVRAYADYYGIPYPLPKLDLVSVKDFAAGAMENWGAITFRESALLADDRTSTFRRQVIAEVVAHEIAHQWFGNLVTMEWWNDIWLNESFATFMGFKMVDRNYPSWDTLGLFLVSETGTSLLNDSLDSTHPIDVEVHNVDEIGQIFDDISYGKGGSVLRMLEAYLGEQVFREGVGDYLRAHAYGNARGDHLWGALEKRSGVPVRRIIDPWVRRSGHPVVKVERQGDHVHLTQRRFRLHGKHSEEVWPVPLTIRAQGEVRRELFDTASRELRLPNCDDLCLNAGSAGFYRVLYDPATYERMGQRPSGLPSHERWAVLRDLFAFLLSRDVTPEVYIHHLRKLREETDAVVTLEAAGQASRLFTIFGHQGPLVSEVRRFLEVQSERLGLEKRPGEPAATGIARETVNSDRAYLDPDFARLLSVRFREWSDMDPDLRGPVAIAMARSGGSSAFDPLVERAQGARTESELEQLIGGLVSFHDGHLVARTLDWAVSGGVSRGMLGSVGVAAARNPDANAVVWPWFRDHLDALEKVYTGTAMLPRVVERLVPMAGLGRLPEVRTTLSTRPIAESERAARSGLEMLGVFERLRGAVLG
ncbi:MAG: M1 family metallopeptidase [Euryarchaeota archaeon]|nr:M1 family metallopeptidase [Euryarchaeota archaeon]MDE1835549.1 M1 family metallopeptidase [Euryarchaeota archaeon]MDE1879640.1 M1 family metallopeptidase [Euryarchaeota archaeon]MDE2043829.1 M1 family metallopeptidase [Thermoplasmata archaeon]